MQPVEPILTVELLPGLQTELLALLRRLTTEEWDRPTVCSLWSVKDIVAHLLDGNIRRLSVRDGHPLSAPETAVYGYQDLINFLNQLNADWIKAAHRISPPLLIEFLDLTGQQVYQFFKTLDPDQPAMFSVGWAGDTVSPNWFDLAREYTEKWLHQQQIREAVGQPGLTRRAWLFPVLDTFMRALPFTYRDIAAAEGTSLVVSIEGEAGGQWALLRQAEAWRLFSGQDHQANTFVKLNQDTAWRLFTKGLDPNEAPSRLQVEGDQPLGAQILKMVSIMA